MSQNLVASKNLVSGAMEFISTLLVENTGAPKGQLASTVATGNAPFVVASTTLVSNLNADLLDGQHGAYYNNIANLSIAGQTTGDVLYYSGAAWTRLGVGANTNVLTLVAGIPAWQAAGSATLQTAYNNGNTISILTNPVSISNSTDTANCLNISRTFAGAGTGLNLSMGASTTGIGINVLTNATATGDAAFINNVGSGAAFTVQDNSIDIFDISATGAITMTPAAAFALTMAAAQDAALNFATNRPNSCQMKTTATNLLRFDTTAAGVGVIIGTSSPSEFPFLIADLKDNYSGMFLIRDSNGEEYIRVNSTTGSEKVILGNVANNPTFDFLGTGLVTINGNVDAKLGLDVTGADLTVGGAARFNVAQATGNVTGTGAWNAAVVVTTYGGTGLSAYTAGDMVYYAAGTLLSKLGIGTSYQTLRTNVGATAPEWGAAMPIGGGTGLTTYAQGDLLYASAANVLSKLAISATDGALLMSTGTVPAWSNPPTATGDILYWNNTTPNWIVLPASTNGLFLRTNGAGTAPTWADPGTGYTWNLTGDSGGPKAIADGETANFVGGAGIVTVISGAATPFLCTINADPDTTSIVATGGSGAQLGVKAWPGGASTDGINETHLALGSGANQIDTTTIAYDTGAAAPVYYTPTNTKISGHLLGIDSALGALASGITWKGPVFHRGQMSDTLGIVQGQVLDLLALPTAAGTFDLIYTNDGTTTRSYGPVGSAANVTYVVVAGDINATIYNIVTAINGDGSRVVNAGVVDMEGIDVLLNDQICLYGRIAGSVHKSWAANSGGGNWLTTQPEYYKVYTDENDDKTTEPNSIPGATNFSTPVAQATLVQNWTYLARGDSSWWLWDDVDNQWTMIGSPSSHDYQAGPGISINTLTMPYSLTTRLDANGGLEFGASVLDMRVKLNGTSLSRLAAGMSIDLTNANTWSGLQTFSHASGISTDTISERTGAAGVTVDSLLIKDGYADRAKAVQDNQYLSAAALAAGDLVYITATSTVDKANATAAATGFGAFLGVMRTLVAAGGSPAPVVENGFADVMLIANLVLNEGYKVFVSKATAGQGTTDVSGFTAGNWIQMVGTIVDILAYVVDGSPHLVRVQIAPHEAGLIV